VDWYPWVVVAHIVGAFGFVAAHGVSMFVAFAIRRDRDPARVRAMLDVSSMSLTGVYLSLLLLLATGIAGGFMGSYWGKAWIWISLATLVGLVVAMYPLGSGHYAKVRRAVGQKAYNDPKDAPPPDPLPPDQLAPLLASNRPYLLAGIGGVALLLIVALMEIKPF
jgi:hypothetical protein